MKSKAVCRWDSRDYFVKPVEFDTLLKAAEEGFRERRQGRGLMGKEKV